MKRPKLVIVSIVVIVLAIVCIAFNKMLFGTTKPASGSNGFAVVELFTSEGCSSCPPADNLVANLIKTQSDKPIYVLAYHVDYWDRLGWKDPFSNAAFTSRQQQYAAWFHLNSIYTPEIVVNGRDEFVGSNKSALDKALQKFLGDTSSNHISIRATLVAEDIKVEYAVEGISKGDNLVVNLVQKSAETSVKSGENAGRKLSHVQVVRNQITQSLKNEKGSLILPIPEKNDKNEWEVIAFVQSKSNGAITAAGKSAVSK